MSVNDSVSLLKKYDPEIGSVVEEELERQRGGLELIASENVVSEAVMLAMGSPLTNKYAEGYPGKRYYGGCYVVDKAELIAIERAKKLFGADHVNVQPHSGAQANMAVYFALLNVGDTVLGMSLACGGHLTHGSPVNMSGKNYNFIPYGVDDNGILNYDELERLTKEHHPKLIVAGASAYPRVIDFERIGKIAHENGALFMVDMAHIAGLVAAGLHQNPVPYADFVTTTTHKTLRGPRGGLILCKEEYGPMINKAVFPGCQGGPLMHVIAGKAVCLKEALSPEFKAYQGQVKKNAAKLAAELMARDIDIVSGGTDNHLMLVNLLKQDKTGKEVEHNLDEVGITCNKNTIPNDPKSPFVTSGVRLGTPAVTTRGFDEGDMTEVADLISMIIKDFEGSRSEVAERVQALCKKRPLYE